MPDREFNNPKELQDFAKERFDIYFNEEVITGRSAKFSIGNDIYSPEPDVAVGPFAKTRKYIDRYSCMAEKSIDFIEMCIIFHESNLKEHHILLGGLPCFENFYNDGVNWNARCFVAVEIENKPPTIKHVLGSTLNAIALGRVGLLVGFSEDTVRKFLRCLKYLDFLKSVRKSNIEFKNGLVLSKDQFIDILKNI